MAKIKKNGDYASVTPILHYYRHYFICCFRRAITPLTNVMNYIFTFYVCCFIAGFDWFVNKRMVLWPTPDLI